MRIFIILLATAVLTFLPFGLIKAVQAQTNPSHFPTHHDSVPNFARNPTIRSVRNGSWSDTTTWNPTRLPTASDVVLISHQVTYDSMTGDTDTIGITTGGVLRFSTTGSTRLRVANLLIQPQGTLEVGTQATPIPENLTAEIIIKNKAINLTSDPDQYGTGLVSVDGTVTMHGAVKTPTFIRLAVEPRAGQTTLTLEQPVSGWRIGDTFVLPDSRQVLTEISEGRNASVQLEVRFIQSLSADGRTVTFAPPLQYNHTGTTDENGDGKPDYLPHIANLARNIIIHSENRHGTRGHVLFTGRAAIDIRYVAFEGLGRTTFQDLHATTNHIGRYSLHMHHIMGPKPPIDSQYQYRLVGNSIYEDTPDTPEQKWGITIHNSHYGLIQDNIVYNVAGGGIVTEDGSESFNVFDHNFVARITSNGGRDEHADQTRGIAREGVGFWFRGPNNYVRNNVAANMGEKTDDVEASYGFKYNQVYLGDIRIPNSRGADTAVPGQYTTRNGNAMPILEFSGNETYGQIQGFTIWWLCTVDVGFIDNCPRTTIRDLVIWHASRYAYYGYPANNITFDGLKVYGDPAVTNGDNHEFKSTFWFGDYATKDLLITNAAFYNTIGLRPPYFRDGFNRIEHSFFKTRAGILHRESGAPGSCPVCDLPDPDTVLVHNQFVPMPGRALRSISWDNESTDPANNDRVFSCNHNRQTGDNFEVFSPVGSGAPCSTTRPDIEGYVCVTPRVVNICSALPPLAAPTDVRIIN